MKNTLSALITIHNEENIISSCLNKLDFCDEIVVVLDKSTDKSKQICQKYTNNIFEGKQLAPKLPPGPPQKYPRAPDPEKNVFKLN